MPRLRGGGRLLPAPPFLPTHVLAQTEQQGAIRRARVGSLAVNSSPAKRRDPETGVVVERTRCRGKDSKKTPGLYFLFFLGGGDLGGLIWLCAILTRFSLQKLKKMAKKIVASGEKTWEHSYTIPTHPGAVYIKYLLYFDWPTLLPTFRGLGQVTEIRCTICTPIKPIEIGQEGEKEL